MFDVVNENNTVISSNEHLWQATLVLLEENCKAGHAVKGNRVTEVDLATGKTIRIVPPAECKAAVAQVMTPEQIAQIQQRYSQ